MAKMLLRVISATKQIRDIPISRQLMLPAKNGDIYMLLDAASLKPVEQVKLLQRNDSLLLQTDQGVVAQIQHYFAKGQTAQFQSDSYVAPSGELAVNSPEVTAAIGQTIADKTSAVGKSISDSLGKLDFGNVLVGAAIVGGALALPKESDGGAAHISNSSSPSSTTGVGSNTVTGTVLAGPALDDNDLKAIVYKADGKTELGRVKVDADGKFIVNTGGYTGVVVVKVFSSSDGADYLDEATQTAKSLGTDLYAMGVVSGAGVHLNVNPITTAAFYKAASMTLTTSLVNSINQGVAQAFGLTDLHMQDVAHVFDSSYNVEDGSSKAEIYGAALAALSALDSINSNNTKTTIDALTTGIVIDGSKVNLTSTLQSNLIAGEWTYNSVQTNSKKKLTLLDALPDNFASGMHGKLYENIGANQLVYIAQSSNAVSYSLKAGGDSAYFSINSKSGEVTLLVNPDYELKDLYTFVIAAKDGKGNTTEQAVALDVINILEDGKVAAVGIADMTANGAQKNFLNTGDVITTWAQMSTAFTVTGTPQMAIKIGENVVKANYAQGSGTLMVFQYTIQTGDTDANGISLVENGLSLNGGSVKDEKGNAANLSYAAVVDNANYKVDATAPVITSGATATVIDENSGANQKIYTTKVTETNPVTYSLKGGVADASAFSINTAGDVTLLTNPDFETKDSYNFTVVVSDDAGNSTEQAVSLKINDKTEAGKVSAIAISSATGASNNYLNVGDEVFVTVSMSANTTVTGTPQISLKIGEAVAKADYLSVSGKDMLFKYVIKASENDSNGISVVENSLALNGGTIKDSAGADLTLSHSAVADNSSYKVDTTAPNFSSATEVSVNENSGANQAVYTSQAADSGSGSVSYTLKPATGDVTAFTIDSGIVKLTANPNYEDKASYSFTVLATDAAGNAAEQPVTLKIKDVAEAAAVQSIAIQQATGAQSSLLNAGDIITVAATMSANTNVTGTPQIALTIGSSTVKANYASGSGSVSLLFNYTIQAGETDADGISIAANSLALNGGSMKDSSSVDVTLTHSAVADNASYKVDTTAPSIASAASATAIAENSGANQSIYTVTSETGASYGLKSGGDASAFSIDSSSGVVKLTANPNYEDKASYSFTVVATDTAGNATEKAVTLAITDVAEIGSVTAMAITAATGAQSNTLNAGDEVTVTATMSTNTTVTGKPVIALKIGSGAGNAEYSSGSGSAALLFKYIVKAGDADTDGISIAANSLSLNGGTMKDASAVDVALTHSAVADNVSYKVDTTAPTFTSSTTATAINENSGANQTIYTAVSETGAVYSLKSGAGDGSAFTIDSTTGAVKLTANPNYEDKSSYSFTVVATDAAGNAGEQAVTLAINDVVETASVSTVAISEVTGAQKNFLNAGDVVTVTATMSAATTVTGTPQISLKIGDTAVKANYTSTGSTSTALLFKYTIQAGETDADGISVVANSLIGNDGTLKDTASSASAVLSHSAVADNASYKVDTTSPTFATASATATAINENSGASQIIFDADGTDTNTLTYSLKNSGDASAFTIDSANGKVTLTANPDYETKTSYAFTVTASDDAGNSAEQAVSLAINNLNDISNTNIVVFDLVEGVSSSHSNRTFDASKTYSIYIRVSNTGATLSTDGVGPGAADTWGKWSSANNLGADDKVVLVSHNGSGIYGKNQGLVATVYNTDNAAWITSKNGQYGFAALLAKNGAFARSATAAKQTVSLWTKTWAINPNKDNNANELYALNMPVGVLTSQGLA